MIEEKTRAARQIEQARQQNSPDESTMFVKVHAPFRVYFEGKAYSISGVNATGPFDILPGHHNFMTLLSACELVVKTPNPLNPTQKILISGGLMHVKYNRVTVFLDI